MSLREEIKGGDEDGRKNSYNHSAKPRDAGARENSVCILDREMNFLCQHLISVSFYRSLLAKEFLSLAFLCGYLYSSMPVLVTMHNPFTFHPIVGPSLQIIGFIPFPRAFKKFTPTYFLAWQIVQILA